MQFIFIRFTIFSNHFEHFKSATVQQLLIMTYYTHLTILSLHFTVIVMLRCKETSSFTSNFLFQVFDLCALNDNYNLRCDLNTNRHFLADYIHNQRYETAGFELLQFGKSGNYANYGHD